jgi:NADPH-dependent 2,4-dienoyl-CoA reductase/sulfur reductase-like enzyme
MSRIQILTLHIQDAKAIDGACKEGKTLVIIGVFACGFLVVWLYAHACPRIGSSFIGMELAVATAERKMAARHVVSMDKVPFISVRLALNSVLQHRIDFCRQNLGEQIGRGLQKFHEGKGVTFHLEAKVEKFLPSSEDPSAVGSVVVNGKEITADVVVLGVGVKPATKFLEGGIQKNGFGRR